MALDAFDPGPDGTYPAFPRKPDGSPAWSDRPETDGKPVPGRGPGGLVTPMPRGKRMQREGGRSVVIDVTPRGPGGVPIDPPRLP